MDDDYELTEGERDALHVLAIGMATRSVRTESDRANGIHCVQGKVANELIGRGLARDVPGWRAVELTDLGRAALLRP